MIRPRSEDYNEARQRPKSSRLRRHICLGMLTHMRTTVEIADSLFERARATMAKRGTTLRALVEEGLSRVVAQAEEAEIAPLRRAVFQGDLGLAEPYQPYDLPELLQRERATTRGNDGEGESDDGAAR